jgi:high potential iron-sulfur protein
MKSTRRRFLKLLAVTPPVALALRVGSAQGQQKPAAMPHVEESDPQAQALGYKHDASKVDKKKFPNFKEGETCANCQHYSGKAGEQWGPCAIFPGKAVNAKGWCSAWAKKA